MPPAAVIKTQGCTVTFTPSKGSAKLSGKITRISVESPSAELVDMTGLNDSVGNAYIVPTGCQKGGSFTIEFFVTGAAPTGLVGSYGSLTISANGFSYSRQVVCETAAFDLETNSLVRGSAKFVPTDYTG